MLTYDAPTFRGIATTNPPGSAEIAEVDVGREGVVRLINNARAQSTRDAYDQDFKRFSKWCVTAGRDALPASSETVARYVAWMEGPDSTRERAKEGYSVASIERNLASISVHHKLAGFESPTAQTSIFECMKGVRNNARDAGRTQRRKTALVVSALVEVLKPFGSSPAKELWDARDRSLLTLGIAGAFRRSELCALEVRDVEIGERGLEITLRKSKTDQDGTKLAKTPITIARGSRRDKRGIEIHDTCPVRSLEAWLALSKTTEGPIFRGIDPRGVISPKALSTQSIALIVRRRTKPLGEDSDYGGHSLRAGFATSAARSDISLFAWMAHMRLRSTSVAQVYVRAESAWAENASGRIGL